LAESQERIHALMAARDAKLRAAAGGPERG
jgi:hypothetical protein